MLRISQPKHTDPRELIISVRVAKDTCPSSIRHIIVRRQKFPQGEVKYLAVEALGFDSVDDLLQHYTKQKTPINPQVFKGYSALFLLLLKDVYTAIKGE
uniref:SH2 domain-containing protein n=1 Tax=Ascaris lumbricoides TaxID=6252 RepID=A0A0M3IXD2_ASCLU